MPHDPFAAALARARSVHPDIEVDDGAFTEFLRSKVEGDEALGPLRLEALYLACAAKNGDARAIAAIERLIEGIDLARFRRDSAFVDEVKQRVRERLFTGTSPRIAEYGGRGDLARWLRAVAVRVAIDMTRATQRETNDDELLARHAIDGSDPELAHMKRHYGEAFRAAMRDALAALDSNARNVLRLYYVDGLTLEELGGLLHVVPSTVWRRLAQARRDVLADTRKLLRERLSIDEPELESVLRLIESRLELPHSVFEEDEKK